jgi:hypothetical protein
VSRWLETGSCSAAAQPAGLQTPGECRVPAATSASETNDSRFTQRLSLQTSSSAHVLGQM